MKEAVINALERGGREMVGLMCSIPKDLFFRPGGGLADPSKFFGIGEEAAHAYASAKLVMKWLLDEETPEKLLKGTDVDAFVLKEAREERDKFEHGPHLAAEYGATIEHIAFLVRSSDDEYLMAEVTHPYMGWTGSRLDLLLFIMGDHQAYHRRGIHDALAREGVNVAEYGEQQLLVRS